MPVYQLSKEPVFPDPILADPSGLLAVGGDLSIERLILAYTHGIFPWYSEGEPILWWSPDPRLILYPEKLRVTKSLRQTMRNKPFEVTFDRAFKQVIGSCKSAPRPGQEGTWITQEMQEAYFQLHLHGLAHSVETWMEGELVGGLYGVSIGRAFFGESMFFKERDASKIALVKLTQYLTDHQFKFIDAQVETAHLKRLGATLISRELFLHLLQDAINYPTIKGKW